MAISRPGGTVREVLVRPGDSVEQGQVLVRLESAQASEQLRQLDKAIGTVQSAIESRRLTTGVPDSLRGVVLESHPDIVDAEKEYGSALAAFEESSGGGREAARRALERAARRRVDSRREVSRALAGAGSGEELATLLGRLRKSRDEAERLVVEADVRAPERAVVDIIDLHPGDRIRAGHPVGLLVLPGEYSCEFSPTEAEVPKLRKGMVLPGRLADGRPVEGRIESVEARTAPFVLRDDRQASQVHVVRARVRPAERLRPGTTVRFQLQ